MRIRKGDTVFVLSGREKGRRGRVDRVLSEKDRVVIEGVNMITRHVRPRPNVRQAGRIQQEAPIHLSNIMLVCNHCTQPTRAHISFLEDGKKVRTCHKCNETID
jgi:large subunit ribosomal protein L24